MAIPRRCVLLVLILVAAGGQAAAQPVAELAAIVVDGRPVSGETPEVLVNDKPARAGTELRAGDVVETKEGAAAGLVYPGEDRAEVMMKELTKVSIEAPDNPGKGIFAYFGEILVGVRGRFKVRTRSVTLASKGTQFSVQAKPDSVRVVPLAGEVAVLRARGMQGTPVFQFPFDLQEGLAYEELREITDWSGPVKVVISSGRIVSVFDRHFATPAERETAFERAHSALAGDSQDAQLHDTLGRVYFDVGFFQEAVEQFERAIRLEPESTYHHPLGRAYIALRREQDAMAEFRKAIELDPEFALPHTNLGLLHYQLGEYQQAIAECQRAIELDPELAMPHTNLGLFHYELGEYQQAIAEYQRAIELDPEFALPHSNLGQLYLRQGKYEQAMAEFRKAIELDPGFALPHNNLGLLHYQRDEYRQAMAEFRKAIELDPELAEPYFGLALVYRQQGNRDEAKDMLRRCLAIAPDGELAEEAQARLRELEAE